MLLAGFSLPDFLRLLGETGSPPRLQNICRNGLSRTSTHLFMLQHQNWWILSQSSDVSYVV